jgi:ABC-2 type transport system ATP-binding protein
MAQVTTSKYIIETRNLKHSFGKRDSTLNNINLKVPQGSIYGFLGENGAGKTTTLKLILGLLNKQHGEILIFGHELKNNRIEILRKIGSLIESPSFYGHLSAVENLIILQKIYQCPLERVAEVINLVGLSNSKNKRVSQFSLGMKQRLSIAIALLHEPELLILDEPTNGLDPKGIIEIRELLMKINAEFGTTIVISSHLLSEIERIVNHIAIINKGDLLFQGEIVELMNKTSATLEIVTDNPTLAQSIIEKYQLRSNIVDDILLISNYSSEIIPILIKDLVFGGVSILEFREKELSLESIFINLTKN